MRTLLSVLGSLIAAAGTAPYILETIRGNTKPRIVTWLTWALLTGVAGAASLSAGHLGGAVFALLGTVATGSVVVASLRYGDRSFTTLDLACLAGVLLGLLLWLSLDNPIFAVWAAILIDFVGLAPTLVHAWKQPTAETASTFLCVGVGGLITSAAIASGGSFSVAALGYPLYAAVSMGSVAAIIVIRRKSVTPERGAQVADRPDDDSGELAGAAARSYVRTPAREPEAWRESDDTAALASASRGTRRAVVAVVAACAAAVLVAVGAGLYITTRGSSPHRAPPPGLVAVNTPVRQAEAWIKANLSRDAPLSAEASVAAALGRDGFSAAHAFPAVGPWYADRFLVSSPAIRTDVTLGLAASAARISSVPVAVFGPVAGRVEVRLIVAGSASGLEARMARDVHDRLGAGRALLANPRVTTDPGPHAVLRGGRLDMRAATVLALLATNADIHVTRLALDKPEAAAGRPVRTVTLSLRNTSALAQVLRMLPHAYAPSGVSAPVGGSCELTWSVGLAPPGLLS